MGWGFRKRIKIAPGIKLNISKKGVSTTIGPRGLSVNVGKKGTHLNAGLPGTGIYSRTKLSGEKPPKKPAKGSAKEPSSQKAPDSYPDRARRALPKLTITVSHIEHQGGDKYHFEFEFCCNECGGYIIQIPDDKSDSGPVTCKACGVTFGQYRTVKSVANYIAQQELQRRGLK